MSDSIQYLTLELDRELFGIDIGHVREILDMRTISKLPHAPPFLLGVIDVRGVTYPIVDLRTKLGLPCVDATKTTRIIVLEVPIHGQKQSMGFVADRVLDVTELDTHNTEGPPDVGCRWQSHYIEGIGRKGSDFIIVLSLDNLMKGNDIALLPDMSARSAA